MRARVFVNGLLVMYLLVIIIGFTFLPWQFVVLVLGLAGIATANVVFEHYFEMRQEWLENRPLNQGKAG